MDNIVLKYYLVTFILMWSEYHYTTTIIIIIIVVTDWLHWRWSGLVVYEEPVLLTDALRVSQEPAGGQGPLRTHGAGQTLWPGGVPPVEHALLLTDHVSHDPGCNILLGLRPEPDA